MTSAALAEDIVFYEATPSAAFGTQQLSSTPYSTSASVYVLTPATTPAWWDQIKARLNHLGQLRPGWDSYKAQAISHSARAATLQLLQEIAGRNTPQPILVPTPDGSIQIEWHTRGLDLEVRVLSPSRMSVSIWDARNVVDTLEDEELQYDLTALIGAIEELSLRTA